MTVGEPVVSGDVALIDWREPERNAHVLDWHERARTFGLAPVDDQGAVEPAAAAPVRLLEEEEPEAFDDQPIDEAEREVLQPREAEETPEDRLLPEEIDPVRVYLRQIARRKLLTAEQEQTIGRKIEAARGALLAELATIPAARETLLALADAVRRRAVPAAELILLPDGGELKPEKAEPVLRAFARLRRLERQAALGRREIARTDEAMRATVRDLPVRPSVVDDVVAALRALDGEFDDLDRMPPGPERTRKRRMLETRAGLPRQKFQRRYARVAQKEQALLDGKHQLIEPNLRLVVSVAKRFRNRGLSLLDLIQEGNIGLMKAVDRFQYRRGFRFSTYAMWWIRQQVGRAVADYGRTIRLPVHVLESLNKVSRARAQLLTELGREPRSFELADRADMPVGKIELLLEAARNPASLETPVEDDQESPLGHLIRDTVSRSPEEEAIRRELAREIERTMSPLTDREREVLRLRHGLGLNGEHSFAEIGRRLSLTRHRVRQIEAEAMAKMRAARDHAA
jgi:RNA polymerase sigma factor (sigma-70 family)